RLNVVPVRIPPLRERTDDIPDLVRHFLGRAVEEGLPPKIFDRSALEVMKNYSWPGNVRELENLVRRLGALYAEEVISADIVQAELAVAGEMQSAQPAAAPADESLIEAVERHLEAYFAAHDG